MKLFQKWRIRKHRQEIKERIEEYNTALTSLSEAAAELLKIAENCNISTEALRQTVEQMKEIAEKAAITPEDLQRGGTKHYGKE